MFEIYYQNVQGLRTKTNELLKNVHTTNYNVIALTETWLNQNISDKELLDDRYVVYRRDRVCGGSEKQDGGGVLLAVTRDIPSTRVESWEVDVENIWIVLQININGRLHKIAICVVYLPPPVKYDKLTKLLESVDLVISHTDEVIILGDFNLNFINWSPVDGCTYMKALEHNSSLGLALTDFLAVNNLYQHNCIPNTDNRFLDLVLSNNPKAYVSKPLKPLSKCYRYHPCLLLNIPNTNIKLLREKPHAKYNYYKADYGSINSELKAIDWNDKFSCCSNVDDMVTVFYSILQTSIDKHVPKQSITKSKYPSWFNIPLINCLQEKEKLRKRFKRFKNPRDEFEYHLLRKRAHKLYDDCHKYYMQTIEKNISCNPKLLWGYIKNKQGRRSHMPEKMYKDNISVQNGKEIVNLFATHFSSVYSRNCDISHYENNIPISNQYISNVKISERDIIRKIRGLDISKGAGPDKIPPIFVKRCDQMLSYPLKIIFNRSLQESRFPTIWKKACLIPVFKKGDDANIINYRPISILSTFSKLFESLVYPTLSKLIDMNLSTDQHGFRSCRSTQSNLVHFISEISQEVDKGMQIDAIYTDFSSAFDKVNHSLLVNKLEKFGLGGVLLDWIKSYLHKRQQYVYVNGHESDMFFADSGVPQGSHLGPLLFLVFINDITYAIKHCKKSMFADDLKLYMVVKSNEDSYLIQEDLNAIEEWCLKNSMTLNAKKCYHIKFTRKKKPLVTKYELGGALISELDEVRDLGVIIDTKLKFTTHINNIVAKAAKSLGFIRRNTQAFKRLHTKQVLYNAFVRSQLEYASVAWNPVYAVQSQRVESIQRSFTRHLAFHAKGFSHRRPYSDRLKYFNMMSLKTRRQVLDTCFLYKLLNGSLHCHQLLESVLFSVPRPNSRSSKKLFYIPRCRTNLGQHSPLIRICCDFNRLTEYDTANKIDLFGMNFNSFKKNVKIVYDKLNS